MGNRAASTDGYASYRHGSHLKPVSLAGSARKPIIRGRRREDILDWISDFMRDWQHSPFEKEGAVRYGLRSALCLEGHGYVAADLEASVLVSAAEHRLGLQRPSWAQGQRDWMNGTDYCSWCQGPIGEQERGMQNRFCGPDCATSARLHRGNVTTRLDGGVMRAAARLLERAQKPVRTCIQCEATFQVLEGDGKFCSATCQNNERWAAERANLAGMTRKCACCGTAFALTRRDRLYCSKECGLKTGRRAYHERTKLNPKIHRFACDCCGATFSTKKAGARYCNPTCAQVATRWKTGTLARLTPLAFDYMLRSKGVGITDALFAEAA